MINEITKSTQYQNNCWYLFIVQEARSSVFTIRFTRTTKDYSNRLAGWINGENKKPKSIPEALIKKVKNRLKGRMPIYRVFNVQVTDDSKDLLFSEHLSEIIEKVFDEFKFIHYFESNIEDPIKYVNGKFYLNRKHRNIIEGPKEA